jgi:putative transposase
MKAVEELAPVVGRAAACDALAVPRASLYRRLKAAAYQSRGHARPPAARALKQPERQQILDVLHSEPFVDKSPAEVYAALLDRGIYLCSLRTMYRILSEAHEVRERRNQLRHPTYQKPQLLATGPNQVWSWDITKLLGPEKWTYFYLYVILDIFSRYVVGWMVASRESAALAQRLIRETLEKQAVEPNQLTIHSDRGPSMKSHSVAQLLATLGVCKSHSRPNVSNDNPFSESQFKTLKYRPDFPDRFGGQEHAHSFCRGLFGWYNFEHYHSGIGMLTPAMVHYGWAEAVRAKRQEVLAAAYAAHPERFPGGPPSPLPLPQKVWINPPPSDSNQQHPDDERDKPLIETSQPFGPSRQDFELQISLLTSAEKVGRLLGPADFSLSLNKTSAYQTENRDEAPVLPVPPDATIGPWQYTNFEPQVSQTC